MSQHAQVICSESKDPSSFTGKAQPGHKASVTRMEKCLREIKLSSGKKWKLDTKLALSVCYLSLFVGVGNVVNMSY